MGLNRLFEMIIIFSSHIALIRESHMLIGRKEGKGKVGRKERMLKRRKKKGRREGRRKEREKE